jgi:hypothetical protein
MPQAALGPLDADHAVLDTVGWQVWQALSGLGALGAWKVEAIQQRAWQAPVWHTLPVSQLVPSAPTMVQAVVDDEGWQAKHVFSGSMAPLW